ncbi:MAG: cellulase family glycosylhydrolase [Planctomycetota bacterium]|jgi:hypothetical protein|nr:cellulase family glycosylhydrolase [Planctomycetota bacterium]
MRVGAWSEDARYLARDGRLWIPVGANVCFPRFEHAGDAGVERMCGWIDDLADNGGDFGRVWLGHDYFDVEHAGPGCFDEARAERIQAVLDRAARRGVFLKLTLEHFRRIQPQAEAERFPGAPSFGRANFHCSHGGMVADMAQWLSDATARDTFVTKLERCAARWAAHPAVVAWELWNEMNAVAGDGWQAWTEHMLGELRRLVPDRLCVQSLGSYDADSKVAIYRWLAALSGNDVVQVHRYLDLGAGNAICHGPVDELIADAVHTLRSMAPAKPLLVAECGAVEPGHARPSDLYARDDQGTLFHDALFAAFAAGACASGQHWHWQDYLGQHGLWWHLQRFARAIAGFNPAATQARHSVVGDLRVHALHGERVYWAWLRDARCDWRHELRDRRSPEAVKGARVPAPFAGAARAYEPWADRWHDCPIIDGQMHLPPFVRSCVVRIDS